MMLQIDDSLVTTVEAVEDCLYIGLESDTFALALGSNRITLVFEQYADAQLDFFELREFTYQLRSFYIRPCSIRAGQTYCLEFDGVEDVMEFFARSVRVELQPSTALLH